MRGFAAENGALALPSSLWAATAAPASETPPLGGEIRVDACVIGGGFTGLSAALHLAEAGAAVAVLETAEPGWGASGRNGGQVIPGLKLDPDALERRFGSEAAERLIALAGGAADFVFDLIKRHGIDCQARRDGWIQAAHAPGAMRQVERRAAQWTKRGLPVDLLDGAEVSRLTGASGYVGGLLDRRGGNLQPLSYARGLARAAQRAGAQIYGRTQATHCAPETAGWCVWTANGAVRARQVLLCTNGYSGPLRPDLAQSIIPAYSYQAATRPLSDNLRRSILPEGQVCSDTRRLLAYFRLDPEGRLVIGGRGRFEDTSDPARYGHITASLSQLFPQVGQPDWEYFWGGRIALTADHLPHLHEPASGLLAGLGYNGRGVAMAAVMGKLLADRAQGKAVAALPLPVSPLTPLPLHGLRRPALAATIAWKRLLDRWDARRAA